MSFYQDRLESAAERDFNDGLITYREYVAIMQEIEGEEND